MLNAAQIEAYRRDGFLAVEDALPADWIEAARATVEDLIERSRTVTAHDSVYDLEPGHSAAQPRVRRLKDPRSLDPTLARLCVAEPVLDAVAALIGAGVRYQASKLNVKAAAFGSPVEWHQDFAFYPHTNDDLLAVGIALDDCTLDNGCMLMAPGSHRGPVLDHHQNGVFVGAVDLASAGIDPACAVPVPVRAGGITLHHCRTLHASAPNVSARPRRLLLVQFTAVDAWPVMGVPDLAAFDAQILRGEPTRAFRVQEMDIRIPLPTPGALGTIYEFQERFDAKAFGR